MPAIFPKGSNVRSIRDIEKYIGKKEKRLGKAGVEIPEEEGPGAFGKAIDLLSRGEYVGAKVAGDLIKYGELPEGKEFLDAITGKNKKTFNDLLTDLGMEDSFGKTALGIGLGIVGDPLTYIPAGKLVKWIGKGGRAVPGLSKVVKGVDDFADWGKRALGAKEYADEALKEMDSLLKGPTARIFKQYAETGKKYGDLKEALVDMSKLDDGVRRKIMMAVENPKIKSKLSKEAKETVDLAKKMFKETGVMKKRLGLMDEEITDYLTHSITPEFEEILKKQGAQPEEYYETIRGLTKRFLPKKDKPRTIMGTITEINKKTMKEYDGVKMFEEDLRKIIPQYLYGYSKNKALVELGQDLLKITDDAGQPLIRKVGEEIPEGLTKLKGLPFKGGYATRPEVAKEINKVVGVISSDEALNKVLKYFDNFLKAWKTSVTVPWWSFQGTNFVGATMMNGIKDVSSLGPKNTKQAIGLLKGKPMKIPTKGGKSITGEKFMEEMTNRGALLDFYSYETGFEGFTKTLMTGKMNPLRGVNKYVDFMKDVGSGIEKFVRTQLALTNYKKTGSFADAAKAVWKTHGNYAPEAMSTAEREVVKRVIPFWTWAKTNIPFHLENLYKKTGKYAALAKTARELRPEEDEMPDWLKNKFIVNAKEIGIGDKKAVTTVQAPMMDLMKLSPRKFVSSYLNPMVKVPMELIFNKELFTDRKIYDEDLPRKMQTAKAYKVLRNLPKPMKDAINFKKVKKENSMTGEMEETYEADARMLYLLRSATGPVSRYYYNTKAASRELEAMGVEEEGEATAKQKALAFLESQMLPTRTYTYSPKEQEFYKKRGREYDLQEAISYLIKRGELERLR